MIGAFVEWNPGRKNSPGWIVEENGCHTWVGTVHPSGHGQVRWKGQVRGAHRARYEREVGDVPEGMDLHHVCENPICCRPTHMAPLTRLEHIPLGGSAAGRNARKEKCVRGHDFDHHDGRQRVCLTCKRAAGRAYMRRRRAQLKGRSDQ